MDIHIVRKTLNVVQGKVLTSIFSFATFLIIARVFPIAEVGSYVFLLGIASMIAMISNWGTNEYLFKEGTISPQKIVYLLAASQFWKICIGVMLGSAVIVLLILSQQPSSLYLLEFVLLLFITTIDAQTISFVMVFRSRGNTRFESWFFPSRAACRLAMTIILSWNLKDINIVLAGMLLVHLICFLVTRNLVSMDRKPRNDISITFKWNMSVLRAATPYATVSLISALYLQVDSLMLGILGNSHDVAIYGVAYQVMQAATFVPMGIGIVLQPPLVRLYENYPNEWTIKVKKMYRQILTAGIILGVLLYLIAPKVVHVIFSEKYIASEPVISVLMIAFVFNFVWISILGVAYISCGSLTKVYRVLIYGLLIMIACNIYLIPVYGPLGAAYSRVISDFAIFMFGTWWLHMNASYRFADQIERQNKSRIVASQNDN